MISIDTEIMRNLVNASAGANSAITEAMETLNGISTHNDWACKEKDAINDYTNINKNKIRQLQENSSSFLNSITCAANEFEQTENSISDMFSSVESIISNILSITTISAGSGSEVVPIMPPPIDVIGPIGNIAESIISTIPKIDWSAFDSFIIKNITEPIAMCNFSDIDLK